MRMAYKDSIHQNVILEYNQVSMFNPTSKQNKWQSYGRDQIKNRNINISRLRLKHSIES